MATEWRGRNPCGLGHAFLTQRRPIRHQIWFGPIASVHPGQACTLLADWVVPLSSGLRQSRQLWQHGCLGAKAHDAVRTVPSPPRAQRHERLAVVGVDRPHPSQCPFEQQPDDARLPLLPPAVRCMHPAGWKTVRHPQTTNERGDRQALLGCVATFAPSASELSTNTGI